MTRKSVAVKRTKTMPCRDCNTPMQVGANTRNAPRCLECGIKAAIKASDEMRRKSGPTYDKYLAAMAQRFR